MKSMMIPIILLLAINVSSASNENICKQETEWIQSDGKRYAPPKTLEKLEISFVNELDGVKLKTTNKISYYEYKSFLDIDGKLGISYSADNGNLLDLFQDGRLVIWQGNTPLLSAKCPTLKLEIGKVK